MKSDAGKTTSIWMATAEAPETSPLTKDIECDTCIVGAGISGLTTAYLLSRAGNSVVVLDDGPLAGGETARTTAHLANALDDRYDRIEKLRGEKGARLAAESHTAAIDQIETIVRKEKIDCDFQRLDGFLFNPAGDEREDLAVEWEAARRAGVDGVELLPRAPLPFPTGGCIRFPRQGQFHPLRYLASIAKAIEREGGRIFTRTRADEIEGGAAAHVKTAQGHVVKAGAIVVATNSPIHTWVAIHTKQAPYRTYAIGARISKGSVTPGLYWDTLSPYHYVRLQKARDGDEHEFLIVGGEDHKTGQEEDPEERHTRLESWARERFPMIERIDYRWSGQVMETVDGLAYIGRSPGDVDNLYLVTGDSGMGMTHGTIAGMLISDLIFGRSNPWAELYDPSRVSLQAAGEFAKENLNVAAQYADYVTPGEIDSVERLAPGEGGLLRRGLKKIAVYRDPKGKLHELSAVCVHLGCIVAWNSLEKTWDCPCHGSRFDPTGKVLNGPANRPLPPASE